MADGSENPPGRPVVLAAATLCMVLRASFEIVRLRPPIPDVDVEQHGRIKDAMLARPGSQASEVTAFLLASSTQLQMNASEDQSLR